MIIKSTCRSCLGRDPEAHFIGGYAECDIKGCNNSFTLPKKENPLLEIMREKMRKRIEKERKEKEEKERNKVRYMRDCQECQNEYENDGYSFCPSCRKKIYK